MSTLKVEIPNIGEAEDVEVIELCVSEGDQVAPEDPLIVLESDKASMEIPSPAAGTVKSIKLSLGAKVEEGDLILELEVAGDVADGDGGGGDAEAAKPAADGKAAAADQQPEQEAEEDQESEPEPEPQAAEDSAPAVADASVQVDVPDVGSAENVTIIEIYVKPGDTVEKEQSLIALESDKASMDIPAPQAGVVESIQAKVGDEVVEGAHILILKASAAAKPAAAKKGAPEKADTPAESGDRSVPAKAKKEDKPEPKAASAPAGDDQTAAGDTGARVHAGPAVRRMARELGVALGEVKGSGAKGRILKEDVQAHVKARLSAPAASAAAATSGGGIPAVPAIDFSKFGPVEAVQRSRLRRTGAANLHRSWLNVPHVTQFDEADITDLEVFRKSLADEGSRRGVKLTPLAFLIKASARALAEFPQFNASLSADGNTVFMKQYFNIGMAVDTEEGLVVPVIRDVDRKTVWQLAQEATDLAARARERKLKPDEMQGGCFSISSLGPLGGTAFTPIVNTPEVAILGVAKSAIKPKYENGEFVPRQMLPVCVSYDHRAVNGADGARFTTRLVRLIEDPRLIIM